jgi:hypothetical protein
MTFIFCTNRRTETIIFETILKRKTTSSFGGVLGFRVYRRVLGEEDANSPPCDPEIF